MKLNNKGFALSTTLYIILILAVVLITLTLSIISNRKVILDKQKEEASTLIYEGEGLSYRQVLAILKLEAIKYASENGFTSTSFPISYSNIEEKTLKKYKLYSENLLVQKNGNTYNVYIKDLKQQLPEEYQQVEYIESNGTQYIDTGFIPNQDTRFVVDWEMTYTPSAAQLMGTRYYDSQNNRNIKSLYIGKGSSSNNYNFSWIYGSSGTTVTSRKDLYGSRHIIDSNKNYLYIDGNELFTANYTNYTAENPIYLFAMSDNYNKNPPPGPSLLTTTKLYSSQIYDNGVLKRNFIPCYRKSDGVIGLYDIVNNVFYTNKRSSSFTKGPDGVYGGNLQLIDYTIDSSISDRYVNTSLPSEYQQIAYVDTSARGPYINTGYAPSSNTNIYIKVQLKASSDNFIFGVSGNSNRYAIDIYSGKLYPRYGSSATQDWYAQVSYSTDVSYRVIDGEFFVNNISYVKYSHQFQNSYPLYLFALNSGASGTASYKAHMRLYYAKIYENGTLERNFVPCYRIADDVTGLYDTVYGVFYTNQGTGSFVRGGNV